jgi:hypothetical protein
MAEVPASNPKAKRWHRRGYGRAGSPRDGLRAPRAAAPAAAPSCRGIASREGGVSTSAD